MKKTVEELLNDLYDVGKKKALGYLPINTLIDHCNKTVEEMLEFASKNGINTKIFGTCNIMTGAIYFYDEKMLSNMLKQYNGILKSAGVPCDDCLEYIDYITDYTVYCEKYPEAYRVIGLTFNDSRFTKENLESVG